MTRRKRTTSPDAEAHKRWAGESAGPTARVPNSFERLSQQCRALRRQADASNGKLTVSTNSRQLPLAHAPPMRSPLSKAPSLPQRDENPMSMSTSSAHGTLQSSLYPALQPESSVMPQNVQVPNESRPVPTTAPEENEDQRTSVARSLQSNETPADRAESIRRKLAENAANGMTHRLSRALSTAHAVSESPVQTTKINGRRRNTSSQAINGKDSNDPKDQPNSLGDCQFARDAQRITFHPYPTVSSLNRHPVAIGKPPQPGYLPQRIPNPRAVRSPSPPRSTSFPDSVFKNAAPQLIFDPHVFPPSDTSACSQDNVDGNPEDSSATSADLISQLQASIQEYPMSIATPNHQSSPPISQTVHPSQVSKPAPSHLSQPRHIQDQGTVAANFMASRPSHGYHKIKLKYWNSIPPIPEPPLRVPGPASPPNSTNLSSSALPLPPSQPPPSAPLVPPPDSTDSWRAVGNTFYGKIGPAAIKEWKPGRFKNVTQDGFQKYNAGGKLVGADPAIYQHQESLLQDAIARGKEVEKGTHGIGKTGTKKPRDNGVGVVTSIDRGNTLDEQSAPQSLPPSHASASSSDPLDVGFSPQSQHPSRADTEEREVRKAMEEFERGDLTGSGSDGSSASPSDGLSTPITPGAE